jgi:type III secretory pathway component EscV
MFLFKKKISSKSSHQDDIYEVVQLESKSEAERRAKSRQLSSGKILRIKPNKTNQLF